MSSKKLSEDQIYCKTETSGKLSAIPLFAVRIRNKAAELFHYREMFLALVERDIRARYKGSILGFFWSLLNPLLMMAVFSLVFAVYMRIAIPNYALFLFAGLLPWNWLATSLNNATITVVANASLIKKIYFPLELLPLINVTANFINFVLSLPVLFLFIILTNTGLNWNLLWLPMLMAIQFLLTLGMALVLTTFNAFFRDIEQLVQPLLLAWFYLTPVIYAEDNVPEAFRFMLYLNPITPLINGYHRVLLEAKPPDFQQLLFSLLLGAICFIGGYAIFHHNKFHFSEVV